MKQLCYYILSVALIFTVCYLIVDSRRPDAVPPVETGAPGPSTAAPQETDGPASGSDLYLPEPFSESAQAALNALVEELRDQDCLCAVAWLGTVPEVTSLAEYLERSELLTALAEKDSVYAFLPELTPANCGAGGFSRLYCLVPLPGSTAVCIRAGERTLYQRETDAPVLFTADDAGFQLSVRTAAGEDWERSVTPQPDGTLAQQPGLLDFTD